MTDKNGVINVRTAKSKSGKKIKKEKQTKRDRERGMRQKKKIREKKEETHKFTQIIWYISTFCAACAARN